MGKIIPFPGQNIDDDLPQEIKDMQKALNKAAIKMHRAIDAAAKPKSVMGFVRAERATQKYNRQYVKTYKAMKAYYEDKEFD